jgi:hypothetical protein
MSFSVDDENLPVTVVVSQLVKRGCEQTYERWIQGIAAEAEKFDGYLGISVIRPQKSVRSEYVLIFKFDHYVNLKQWMESDTHRKWLEKTNQLVQDAPNYQQLTGMETWFTLPDKPPPSPPPRYKMAILTWLAVYILLNILSYVLAPVVVGLPVFLRSFVISAVMIVLMTYAVMPQMTHLFYKWLYPR